MSDHEQTLRKLGTNYLRGLQIYTSAPEELRASCEGIAAACLSGADALVREGVLRGIIAAGVVRYRQNGGCSNCGGVPHTATCLVGQLELWLEPLAAATREAE